MYDLVTCEANPSTRPRPSTTTPLLLHSSFFFSLQLSFVHLLSNPKLRSLKNQTMSTFDTLVQDLTRDVNRAQPKDALQFCANWFQARLEEQRARTRDILARRSSVNYHDLPSDLYVDTPLGASNLTSVSPFSTTQRHSYPHHRPSIHPSSSPFGTLNVPGNALLANTHAPPPPPTLQVDPVEVSPTTATGYKPMLSGYDLTPTPSPGDYLHAPSATILARRTSVSAESIVVDSDTNEPTPVFPKSPEQLRRIKSTIVNNFIFRGLDEEQETGVLNAMQEIKVPANEVVIKQGDVGEYFYVVENGLLHCFIHPDPPPTLSHSPNTNGRSETFVQPGHHPEFGRREQAKNVKKKAHLNQ